MNKLFIIFFLTIPVFLSAQIKMRAKKEESSISYTMKHPLHEWTGTSKELNCVMETSDKGEVLKVAAVVKLASFDSKNSNRDSHMIEVADGLTYPNISFASTSIASAGAGRYKVYGKINFHGVEKPMELLITEEKKENKRIFTGSFQILLEDFKVERPTLMLVKTENAVIINLKAVF